MGEDGSSNHKSSTRKQATKGKTPGQIKPMKAEVL